jgi:hypothetical protein
MALELFVEALRAITPEPLIEKANVMVVVPLPERMKALVFGVSAGDPNPVPLLAKFTFASMATGGGM